MNGNAFAYILRSLYKIRYWVICGSLLAFFIGVLLTRDMKKEYEVSSSIYTGFVAGFSLGDIGVGEKVSHTVDFQQVNNSVDNLIGILTARYTLKKVSMRLFIQDMTYGNPYKDNNYITAANFRYVYSQTPQEVRDLIDKSSEEVSMQRLLAYEKASPDNYVYGLFNWNHPLYGYKALSRVQVNRIGTSDMMELKFSSSDPGVAYNTILFLYDELIKEYKTLRFGEVDDVIAYFMRELEIAQNNLTNSEDALTRYNVANRVVNYDRQTEALTSLDKDHQMDYENVLRQYYASKAELETLDENMRGFTQAMKNNSEFLNRMNDVIQKSKDIAYLSYGDVKNGSVDQNKVQNARREYKVAEDNLLDLKKSLQIKNYTKEGVAAPDFIDRWFKAQIDNARSDAELKVMEQRSKYIDNIYVHFSPIGTTLKRKEREINFEEQVYLSDLMGLNNAKLRRKSLQVSSSSLKILNPPDFPISPLPSKRKMILILTFLGSAVFIIAIMLILEILDRSLKDKFKAEYITKGAVLAAFPANSKFKYRMYNRQSEDAAIQYLANGIMNNIHRDNAKRPLLINFLSSFSGEGKRYLTEKLIVYWEASGLQIKRLVSGDDFLPDSKEYVFAEINKIFDSYSTFDILLVVHPELAKSPIPETFLKASSLNLFFVNANRVWSDADQVLLDNITRNFGKSNTMLVLTNAERDAVETFTGMLPPHTFWRKIKFKLLQMGTGA
ncbi:MAG: hypothetical protein PHW85_00195 [Bacteroidales bacterium]|nr:hypothetical protein [Bacteroidales bacterium]MDD2241606.1 hypothetical protein [Bacteroidales bacterium]MDD4420002.1 hypothetical protein [Bacteroidales bacterium]